MTIHDFKIGDRVEVLSFCTGCEYTGQKGTIIDFNYISNYIRVNLDKYKTRTTYLPLKVKEVKKIIGHQQLMLFEL